MLNEIYDSFFTDKVNADFEKKHEFVNKNVIRDIVTKTINRILENKNLDNEHRIYYNDHLERYIEILSLIPKAKPGERVLEVGSFTIFSYFLKVILGYNDITGLDIFPDIKEKEITKNFILNDEYFEQKILNINLNNKLELEKLQKNRYNKIFFFEVLEHLHYQTDVLKAFRNMIEPGGNLFLSCPNCASGDCLDKLLTMRIPMVYSGFDEYIEKTHYREHTPLTLKYLLKSLGYTEKYFTTLYIFSRIEDCKNVFNLYPFKEQPEVNKKLQGDNMFCILSVNDAILDEKPDIFYDFKKFYAKYHDFPSLHSFFAFNKKQKVIKLFGYQLIIRKGK